MWAPGAQREIHVAIAQWQPNATQPWAAKAPMMACWWVEDGMCKKEERKRMSMGMGEHKGACDDAHAPRSKSLPSCAQAQAHSHMVNS